MKKRLIQNRSKQKGFTLLEFLIVMGIPIIIIPLVILNVAGFRTTETSEVEIAKTEAPTWSLPIPTSEDSNADFTESFLTNDHQD